MFLSLAFAPAIQAQVLESDYGSEQAILGLEANEDVEEVEEVVEPEVVAKVSLMDILAVAGGVVLILLFAYIVYSKREKVKVV